MSRAGIGEQGRPHGPPLRLHPRQRREASTGPPRIGCSKRTIWATSVPTTPARIGWLARWRDFVDAGLHIAAATDTPWVYPALDLTDTVGRPVDQIAGGMVGRGLANPDTPEWVLDQRLTAEQGLRAVTVDAPYALGDESRRGHLAPGTLGDVTILSGDVTDATPDEIRSLEVIATIVGGVVAYCSDLAVCGDALAFHMSGD